MFFKNKIIYLPISCSKIMLSSFGGDFVGDLEVILVILYMIYRNFDFVGNFVGDFVGNFVGLFCR